MHVCYLLGKEQFTSVALGGAVLRLPSFCHLKETKQKGGFPKCLLEESGVCMCLS